MTRDLLPLHCAHDKPVYAKCEQCEEDVKAGKSTGFTPPELPPSKEPLPCPHCKEPIVAGEESWYFRGDGPPPSYAVRCDSCGAQGPYGNGKHRGDHAGAQARAIELWNDRGSPEPLCDCFGAGLEPGCRGADEATKAGHRCQLRAAQPPESDLLREIRASHEQLRYQAADRGGVYQKCQCRYCASPTKEVKP